jgi:hypothetical protein
MKLGQRKLRRLKLLIDCHQKLYLRRNQTFTALPETFSNTSLIVATVT